MLKDNLIKVRELIASGWTQQTAARNANGEKCWPRSPYACQFCIIGAINRATNSGEDDDYLTDTFIHDFIRTKFNKATSQWNDEPNRTQQEVLDMLDLAIASVQ